MIAELSRPRVAYEARFRGSFGGLSRLRIPVSRISLGRSGRGAPTAQGSSRPKIATKIKANNKSVK